MVSAGAGVGDRRALIGAAALTFAFACFVVGTARAACAPAEAGALGFGVCWEPADAGPVGLGAVLAESSLAICAAVTCTAFGTGYFEGTDPRFAYV